MEPRPSTISELESQLQQALSSLREIDERGELPRELKPLLHLSPPEGASLHVSLRHRDTGHQLRLGGLVHSWVPRTCGAWIVFEVATGLGTTSSPLGGRIGGSDDPLGDFLIALDHVEKDPHLRFVSLKWFRDTYLPKRGYDWATDPDIPRRMVHQAAESDMILTSKVPNPKTPEFPVTTIRLNRDHPRVAQVLASIEPKAGGEPSSGTAGEPSGDGTAPSPAKRPRKRPAAGGGSRETTIEAQ